MLAIEALLADGHGYLHLEACVRLQTVGLVGHSSEVLCTRRSPCPSNTNPLDIGLSSTLFVAVRAVYLSRLSSAICILNASTISLLECDDSARLLACPETVSLALGFGRILEAISLALHCLEALCPGCMVGCSCADGQEVFESAFTVLATARSENMRKTSQIPGEYLGAVIPAAVDDAPEVNEAPPWGRHGAYTSKFSLRGPGANPWASRAVQTTMLQYHTLVA